MRSSTALSAPPESGARAGVERSAADGSPVGSRGRFTPIFYRRPNPGRLHQPGNDACNGLGAQEEIGLHHLHPGRSKITHKLLACLLLGIHLSVGAQNRV